MRSYWLVARHEYRRVVVRKGFIIGTVAIPLGFALLIALVILVENSGENRSPIGYIDESGLLDPSLQASLPNPEDRIPIVAFSEAADAEAALRDEEIQAYFVLPSTYPQSLQTELYYLADPPSSDAWRDFDNFIRLNLVAGYGPELQQRLLREPDVTIEDITYKRTFSETSIANLIMPFVATLFFFVATMIASGYMLQVVADEKENRTMELMLTSVTPRQLIGGKALGLLAASLSQLAIYIAAAVVMIAIAANFVPELQRLTVPWDYLFLMGLFFLPAYALIAAMMVALGSAVTELQQGQQVAGLLNLLFIFPLFVLPLVFTNPSHPLLIFLTLFPTTSFLTVSIRWGLGGIPQWQLALSWIILVSTALFMIWAAARIFRAGMLRYGQSLSLNQALAVVRGR